jgi:hypothetical protein
MTRYEYIKNLSVEDLAEVLSCISQVTIDKALDTEDIDYESCKGCIAYDHCKLGHNGFIDWLNKEAKFSKVSKDFIVWDD